MAFIGYSKLLELSASGKEDLKQSRKILEFSAGITGNDLNGCPIYITNFLKKGFLRTRACLIRNNNFDSRPTKDQRNFPYPASDF